jgi:hypothetical protein
MTIIHPPEDLRDQLLLALMLADVGESWHPLIDLIDALVAAAVFHALSDESEPPFC